MLASERSRPNGADQAAGRSAGLRRAQILSASEKQKTGSLSFCRYALAGKIREPPKALVKRGFRRYFQADLQLICRLNLL